MAKRERDPETGNWERVVDLVQTAFRNGTLPTKCIWHTVVILLKGNRDYRWIRLIGVLWNTVLLVINIQIGAYITYYDVLYRFRVGRGTETTSLEAKLLQQLTEIR